MKTLGAAILLVGCASGGTPFSPPPSGDDQPDAAKQPDGPPIEPPVVDAPAPPTDEMILPADAAVTPDACVPQQQQKLGNPALDLTPNGTGWVEVPLPNLPGGPFPIVTTDGFAASSAPLKAWMGGAAGGDASPAAATISDQLYQDITFPADATNFIVSGMQAVGTTDDPSTVFDTFSLDITETNGSPIENVLVLNNTSPTGVWTAFSKTLSSNLAGRTVRLRATSTNDDIFHTNFFLDTLSFKATACP